MLIFRRRLAADNVPISSHNFTGSQWLTPLLPSPGNASTHQWQLLTAHRCWPPALQPLQMQTSFELKDKLKSSDSAPWLSSPSLRFAKMGNILILCTTERFVSQIYTRVYVLLSNKCAFPAELAAHSPANLQIFYSAIKSLKKLQLAKCRHMQGDST